MNYRLFYFFIFFATVLSCKLEFEKSSTTRDEEVLTDDFNIKNSKFDSITAHFPGQDIEEINWKRSKKIPKGMVYIRGGVTTIGSENGGANEKPLFTTKVEAFLMDKNLVTVGEFRKFVNETGYVTFSEEIGDGIIHDIKRGGWYIKKGAFWEYPLGPDQPKAKDDHPVTLLTYKDAESYLNWVGKRLPTEIEWEHAARGGTKRYEQYAWGDQLEMEGVFMANTWTGIFPLNNNGEDGYVTTSPVGKFGETELGLTDMGGNVWEWTSSWYRSWTYYILVDTQLSHYIVV